MASAFSSRSLGDRVSELPGLASPLLEENFAGFIPVGKASMLFYSLSCARNATPRANSVPLILWINGGPGASSLTGYFFENGPYSLIRGKHGDTFPLVKANPFSWNTNAHVLYVDNPVGTGFSFCDGIQVEKTASAAKAEYNSSDYHRHKTNDTSCFVTSLEEAASQLADLLARIMFEVHPEILANSPLFLTGESFAGKFLPYTAAHILEQAVLFPSKHPKARLGTALRRGGVAVGNPEINTLLQYPLTLTYLRGNAMLGPKEERELREQFFAPVPAPESFEEDRATKARASLRGDPPSSASESTAGCAALVHRAEAAVGANLIAAAWREATAVCEAWLDLVYQAAGNPFRYDIRLPNGAFQQISKQLKQYLMRPDVGKALHTQGRNWSSGDGESEGGSVASALNSSIEKPGSLKKYASVLELGIPVLIFDGTEDGSPFNHMSTENAFENMSWSGQRKFNEASHKPWSAYHNGTLNGYSRSSGNFTYLTLLKAGHLVPMDQPRVALAMIEFFVQGFFR
ncbi:hypothetical protein CYMTET_16649 [Cymbomonas tetramitiformis]|uniref:Carboxypeptidase n=1 Tax=Cymbomonas tetramitiformis TaxID=36881 RepID=A0AAE0L7Q8_9CHLO|nr:hypothetical protein CYMTET_16649 [Cymbomonas tetramitiformis]|eukprot:gene14122-16701_t